MKKRIDDKIKGSKVWSKLYWKLWNKINKNVSSKVDWNVGEKVWDKTCVKVSGKFMNKIN